MTPYQPGTLYADFRNRRKGISTIQFKAAAIQRNIATG